MPEWSGEREFNEPDVARQMLAQTPIISVGALQENTFGRLVGTCRPFREAGVLIAPISGRSCFQYLVHVEAVFLGHRQHFGERRGCAFVLQDGDERAVIDPIYARLRIRYEHVADRDGYAGSTATEQELLRRLRIPRDPPGAPLPKLRFQEARIEPGNRVAVCGSGVREADPDGFDPSAMYRGDVPHTRLRIVGSARAPIAISTDPELLL